MKAIRGAVLLCTATAALSEQTRENPLSKVLSLMDDLAAKITKEGEAEAKAYAEYVEWCDDVSTNGKFAIETATKEKAKLEAKLGKLVGDIDAAGAKIDDLAGAIGQAEAELQNATDLREKEAADFSASEKELTEVIDTMERAIGLIGKEASKNPAALSQIRTGRNDGMLQALTAVLDAAAFPGVDQKRLAAFMQEQQTANDADAELGAPAAATYKSHSGGIMDVLEDMKEKAEGQLSDLRKAEKNAAHNFAMLKQSLVDQLAADNKDMAEEKAGRSAAEEAKAGAEGDLDVTTKDLKNSQENLANAQSSCMQTAADHDSTVAARAEELKVIAEAKKILAETTGGAESQTYSFAQVGLRSRLRTRADLAGSEVVMMVKQLSKKEHSAALAQLASRIAAVIKFGTLGGDDPFAKVKGLITDMIAKLESQAGEEAAEKQYCDEQMSKTAQKKAELEEDVAKMTTKIDQAVARSTELKAQVKELQNQLSALARQQAEMDKMRQETRAEYETAKADLTLGLSGVRKALGVLREYYGASLAQQDSIKAFMQQPAMPQAHSKAGGAGSSIIGILEVCESDFAKNLAKEETQEEDAQSAYEKQTQENKLTKTSKEQDVKYKSKEAQSLDGTVTDVSGDRETTNTELAAVLEYYAKIKERCIAKPETYEERQRRRAAEIAGLKSALSTLEDETAFVQRKRRGSFRGTLVAM